MDCLNEENDIKCTECIKLNIKDALNKSSKNVCLQNNFLHIAAAHGFLEECKTLVDNGANINEKNDLGWTPLMEAVKNGHYSIIEMFIEYGGNVDLCCNYGMNCVMLAAACKDLKVLQLVSQASEEQENSFKMALELACLYGHNEIVQWLLSATIHNLNESSSVSGLTPLMLATLEGHIATVKLLLDYGADPFAQNLFHHSAVDIANYKNNLSIKSLLYRNSILPKSPFQLHTPEVFLKTPTTPNYSSEFIFPPNNKLSTMILPSHIHAKHSPLFPLSPFPQNPQFTLNLSPCCCRKTNANSNSWYDSSSSSCNSNDAYSEVLALISPRHLKKYSNNISPASSNNEQSSQKTKKRKLFDMQWYSSLFRKIGKKRLKLTNDANNQQLEDLPMHSSNSIDFSQILFALELEQFWPIFKSHEVDIGIFLTLTSSDLDMMEIKDIESQTLILNKIEDLKRIQL